MITVKTLSLVNHTFWERSQIYIDFIIKHYILKSETGSIKSRGAENMFTDVKDSDVYDYRKSKEIKIGKYIRTEMANDTSVKKSIRTSIGFIDIYIYYPKKQTTNAVYFNMHGGGMCLGYYQLDIPYCKLLVQNTGAIVVNIDYCLAPGYRFPLAYTTTYEVLKYCNENRKEFGFGNSKFLIGGNSAGGEIAMGVIQLEKKDHQDFIKGLILNYAPCDQKIKKQDVIDPKKAISPDRIHQYQAWEYNTIDEIQDPLSAAVNSDPRLYPDTLINSAEYDSLRAGEEQFAKQLKDVGVHVDYRCFKNCQHGFTHKDLKEFNPDASKEAWQRIADFIVKIGKEDE